MQMPSRFLAVGLLRALGTPLKAIGGRLGISTKAAEAHYARFAKVIGTTDPAMAALWAVAMGYIRVKR